MAGLESKAFSNPDETRPFAGKGKMDIVNVAGMTVGLGVFEPGWRWSVNVKPLAGTDSCQAVHNGYVVSGRMHVVMDDGTEAEAGPGDIVHIDPGHDAWVVGNEACVMVDFGSSVGSYAKPRSNRGDPPYRHHVLNRRGDQEPLDTAGHDDRSCGEPSTA
jgi:hypothetical protein